MRWVDPAVRHEAVTGSRRAYWRADLLDYNDEFKRPLHEFSGGSYEQNANRAVRGGGSLNFFSLVPSDDIEWGSDRFQIWYSPGVDADGEAVEWPMGIFTISMPDIDFDDETGTMSGEIKMMDKLSILDQDNQGEMYTLKKGTLVVDAITRLIRQAGETNYSIEYSNETLSRAMTWEEDTAKLQVINDLLSTINFFRLRADGYGQFQAGPFVPTLERAPVHTFRSGEDSLHVPQWSKEDDWFKSPNRVIMLSQGDDDTPGLKSVAENTSRSSKYSYQARGRRWITHVETGVEVTSQAMLDSLAKMRLGGLSTTISNLTVQHAPLEVYPEDRVELVTPVYTASCEIRSYTVSMDHSSLMEGSWREIIYVD